MIPFKKFIPGIAWFFLVLVLLCLPGEDLPKTADWMNLVMFDKWVHVGLFSVLGFLFMLPFARTAVPRKKKLILFARIAVSVSIWGITTEFIQKFYIPGRTFDLWDWAADSLGAVFSFLAGIILLSRQKITE
jgi:VanZ family protein